MSVNKIYYKIGKDCKVTTDLTLHLAILLAGFKSNREVAGFLGISETYLCLILKGERKPGKIIEKILCLKPAISIEAVIGILAGLFPASRVGKYCEE